MCVTCEMCDMCVCDVHKFCCICLNFPVSSFGQNSLTHTHTHIHTHITHIHTHTSHTHTAFDWSFKRTFVRHEQELAEVVELFSHAHRNSPLIRKSGTCMMCVFVYVCVSVCNFKIHFCTGYTGLPEQFHVTLPLDLFDNLIINCNALVTIWMRCCVCACMCACACACVCAWTICVCVCVMRTRMMGFTKCLLVLYRTRIWLAL